MLKNKYIGWHRYVTKIIRKVSIFPHYKFDYYLPGVAEL